MVLTNTLGLIEVFADVVEEGYCTIELESSKEGMVWGI